MSADLLRENARAYADVAIENVRREFPNILHYVNEGPDDRPRPREVHPAFYGSLDWHSCVEMVWVLVRLARVVPGLDAHPGLRETLDEHVTPETIAGEVAFFEQPRHRPIERPYGWGWLLRLAAELDSRDDEDGRRWSASLRTLAELLAARFVEWLPRQTYPIRAGVHGNSAFGLVLALPYARSRSPELEAAIGEAAQRWFGADEDYPAGWEPSGNDFLSPALTEAVLMQELLAPDEFAAWLDRFLPGLRHGEPRSLFEPAVVSDPSDGQIAHLHGLNLFRAWAFRRLGLDAAAERHAAASLPHVTGSDYMVEHWLAAYAVLYLS